MLGNIVISFFAGRNLQWYRCWKTVWWVFFFKEGTYKCVICPSIPLLGNSLTKNTNGHVHKDSHTNVHSISLHCSKKVGRVICLLTSTETRGSLYSAVLLGD